MTLKLAYIPGSLDDAAHWEVQQAMPCYHLGCTAYHWVWLMRTENRDKALAMLVPSNWSIL